ncbi:MAG: GAF domain-containing protein [Clostridium sp.]
MNSSILSNNIIENYETMVSTIFYQLKDENDVIANLSNISSYINFFMKDINWVGFYLNKNKELVLGPFQGKPACIRIPFGKGVCGTAAETQEIQVVKNVHEFPGHIACDSESLSEIVVPVIVNGEVYGVLDIDSPSEGRFGEVEKKYLTLVVNEIEQYLLLMGEN